MKKKKSFKKSDLFSNLGTAGLNFIFLSESEKA